MISLVFGISSLEGESAPAHILYIDNLHVGCACPVAKNVRVEELDETTVSLRWNRDEDVEEWLVKVVGNGQQEIYTSTETSYTMGDLTAATEYTVSVGHLCGADTSAWTSISFTTAGAECAPVSNPEVSNITRNSAVLSWSGSASDYRIRIREVSDEPVDWGYYLVQGAQSYTLPLEMATRYEGGVQALCNPLAGDTSEYVDFEPFTTLALTCFAPSNLIPTVVDHQSIQLSWTGESNAYQVEWQRRMGGTPAGSAIVDNANEYLVEGLEPETTYEFHIRSICSEGDTSDWSSYVMATTGIRPPCPAPTNLRVESITETSASLLWDTEEDASSFLLRHRATNVMAWDSVRDLSETQYNLAGLEPNTAYVWSVLMACSDGRYSGWATQNNFTTEETANETLAGNGLSVTASKGQIHVMNPSAVYIERIRVYDLTGSLREDYVVRDKGNVILTTELSTQVAIVEILLDANQAVRFKVLIP